MAYRLLSFFLTVAAYAQTLSVGSVSANVGATALIPITIQTGNAAAATQWTLNAPVGVTIGAASAGSATTGASKTVTCIGASCVVSGSNNIAILDGNLAYVPLTASTAGTYNITLTNVLSASPGGTALPTTGLGGTFTVNAPPPPPPVTISISPSSVSLSASGTQQFTATVSGTAATPAWSLSPVVGTLTATGLYTAPASVSAITTLAVTATVGTAVATATITLNPPPVTISVSPSSVSLGQSGTQQFTATAGGTTSAPTWSVTPAVGTISATGLYTAPASIAALTTVTVTATVSTGTASATITLTPPTPPPPPTDTTAPTISITYPGNGASIPRTTVTLTCNAADNVGVASVQWKVDGVNIQNGLVTTSPFSAVYNAAAIKGKGTHTLSATVADAAGNTKTATVTFRVQ